MSDAPAAPLIQMLGDGVILRSDAPLVVHAPFGIPEQQSHLNTTHPNVCGATRSATPMSSAVPSLPTYAPTNTGFLEGSNPEPQLRRLLRIESSANAGEHSISFPASLDQSPANQTDVEAKHARQQEWLTRFIVARWRMVPLDIIAEPLARRMIDKESQESDSDPLTAGPRRRSSSRGGASVSVTVTHAARLWWRRKIIEPIIHQSDDAFTVWRKAVFTVMITWTLIITLVKVSAALVSAGTHPVGGWREGGYFILMVGFVALKLGIYIAARLTQRLSVWAFYGVLVLLMVEVHAWLMCSGPHFTSITVLHHNLLLLIWLFAVEEPLVKFCGVLTTFGLCVTGIETANLLDLPDSHSFGSTEAGALVGSKSFLVALSITMSLQSVISLSTVGFLLFEKHAAQSTRAVSMVIQHIARLFVVDDYASAMDHLDEFHRFEKASAIGGSAGKMLGMRLADLAEIMRQLRPFVPDHVFWRDGEYAADRDLSGNNIRGAHHASQSVHRSAQSEGALEVQTAKRTAGRPSSAAALRTERAFFEQGEPTQHAVASLVEEDAEVDVLGHDAQIASAVDSGSQPLGLQSDKRERRGHGGVAQPSQHVAEQGSLSARENTLPQAVVAMSSSTETGGGASDITTVLATTNASQQPPFQSVTLVLVTFRGRQMVANVSILDEAVKIIKRGDGMVELVGYSHLLASFFGEKKHHAATLSVIIQLRNLFQHRRWATVSAHHGLGWAGLCNTTKRRWRFVGGAAVESLWRMPSIARQTMSMCIATETVVEPNAAWVCPVDIVQLDGSRNASALAEIVYEIVGGTMAQRASSPTLRASSSQRRTASLAPHFGEPAQAAPWPEGEGGIQLVVPTMDINRNCMIDAVRLLCQGQPLAAVGVLRRTQAPSWHVQRLCRSLVHGHKRGRRVIFKEWLGWGILGAKPSLMRTSYRTDAPLGGVTPSDSGLTPHLKTPGTSSTVNAMEWSTTSTSVARTSRPHDGGAGDDALQKVPTTVFERVTQRLEQKKAACVEQTDGLFSMFLDQQTDNDHDGAADDNDQDGEEIVLVDNQNRRYVRGKRLLGRGAYGAVHAACGEFGGIVAVKCIDVESTQVSAQAVEISAEIHTLSQLRHDNIVGYIGDCFLRRRYYYIIMECVPGGSLGDLLAQFGRLPANVVAVYVRDALLGLHYLHQNGVVHCDIKPHNILIAGSGRCKLSDFGSAVNYSLEGLLAQASRPAKQTRSSSSEDAAFVPLAMPRGDAHQVSLQTQQDVLRSGHESDSTGQQDKCDAPQGELGPDAPSFLQTVDDGVPAKHHPRGMEPTSDTNAVSDDHDSPLVIKGTAQYMSPEACRQSAGSRESDVWSVGITVYQLITGELPWLPKMPRNDALFIRELGKAEEPLALMDWARLTGALHGFDPTTNAAARRGSDATRNDHAESFIRCCLTVNVAERATIPMLLEHPFLKV